ncbi:MULTISPECIES: single-stranded-DNA-specific exonuclease RecJ [Metabacillus]|uniref:Single-stranded-DNA-specific exonuclease RecJ n=2 Tax=Metabacillus TaxID=2675233 RepID=A0A179SXE4_9BACI|nr:MULTISPECIES: single-stranded-DNA-specific exonuclease RecJ [Metabacillus]OAS84962.1 single-stranded-DNA-specific exonuclease RecJ [Metabacillus litoralis]QNF26348.1 single-stranded-DNA-specific exonuclease RecJ [Metabacillus sp. KUDC1714]
MLKAKTRWMVQPSEDTLMKTFIDNLSITPLVASLLVNRGINTIEKAREFLQTKQQTFHDPFLLKDMDKAVHRIKTAIENREHILVYGDYDADGVSSTTVLLTTLSKLGAQADFYIPNRFTEGYGPNETAFRQVHEKGFSLIITVDTGIAAVHEAEVAKELGIDLIITDHHEPGPVLPDALAIIHPKQPGCPYPFKELAGVGVAFKLSHALLGELPADLLEVAAIGTIADLVTLHGENRLIAKIGIEQLKSTSRTGLKALLKVAKVTNSDINEDTIGFALAPRINAVGRLQSADPAVDLLLTEDAEEAIEIAQEIDLLNKERQKLVSTMTEEAIEQVESSFPITDNPVLVIAKEGWNPGVVGIVASRLVERYYRPTIVLSVDKEKGVAKGSARSIIGFDLFENLSTCRDILPHFGGHPMAAGMTLELEDVDLLRQRLVEKAKTILTDEDFTPITKVDVSCKLEDISVNSIEEMQLLAPFGMHNPKPIIQVEDVTLANIRKIGAEQNHLKLVFEQEEHQLDSVGFGFGYIHDDLSPTVTLSAIGELSINEWNNFRKPQLMLQDVKVDQWQLFDYRGTRNVDKLLKNVNLVKNSTIITFQSAIYEDLKQKGFDTNTIFVNTVSVAQNLNSKNKNLVLMDIPSSLDLLDSLFVQGKPDRIYTVFLQEADHFFATIPTRDHFKWYYSFLLKKGSFKLKEQGEQLAKHKGWSKETIEFMSQVFFELEFVTIENGVISTNSTSRKRDLAESKTYAQKQMQIELEKTLLYTSYMQLKQWFEERFQSTADTFVNV